VLAAGAGWIDNAAGFLLDKVGGTCVPTAGFGRVRRCLQADSHPLAPAAVAILAFNEATLI
jgi:hypothetical protein